MFKRITTFIRTVDVKDYISKQIRFSTGNLPSVPIGTSLLYGFTTYFHIWYIYSSFLSLIFTTIISMTIQVMLGTIKVKRKAASSEHQPSPDTPEHS